MTPALGMVLAAGRGRRLAPLTDAWAKPTLPFLDRALVTYSLDVLCRAGVKVIAVNACYRAQQIVTVVNRWRDATVAAPEIRFVREPECLGTGGGARGLWEALGRPESPVPVLNGDIVTDFDLMPHWRSHRAAGDAATLIVSSGGEGRVYVEDSGPAERDPCRRRVVALPSHAGIAGHPEAGVEMSFVGASILSPEAFEELPSGSGCLFRDGLVGRHLEAGAVGASFSRDRHWDVGTPQRYWMATVEALRERPQPLPEARSIAGPGVRIHPPVQLDPGLVVAGPAELGPFLVLGPGVRIGPGVRAGYGVASQSELSGRFWGSVQVGTSRLDLSALTPDPDSGAHGFRL